MPRVGGGAIGDGAGGPTAGCFRRLYRRLRALSGVTPTQLPSAIRGAVANAFPQASIDKKAQRVIENGQTRYVFAIKTADGGKKVKVTASPTGELNWK